MDLASLLHQPTVQAAQDLLGCELISPHSRVIITETEAYCGVTDPASHAFRGPTKRQEVMFGPSGHLYVYLIYGIHNCINIVAHSQDEAAGGVLIRGVRVLPSLELISGPGRVAKFLAMDRSHNGLNVLAENSVLRLQKPMQDISPWQILATPRIGITKATEKLWRFVFSPIV